MILSNAEVPLYVQLADLFRQRIAKGVWKEGDKLPSLEQLVGEFEVARVTVRQAIDRLARDGLVLPQRGRGTFVTAAPQQTAGCASRRRCRTCPTSTATRTRPSSTSTSRRAARCCTSATASRPSATSTCAGSIRTRAARTASSTFISRRAKIFARLEINVDDAVRAALVRMDPAHVDVALGRDAVALVQHRAARRLVDVEDGRVRVAVDVGQVLQRRLDAQPAVCCGAAVTKVPRPRCGRTRPSRARRSIACRTVTRATSNSPTSCSSEGSLSPSFQTPLAIRCRNRSASWT
jgi:DNA-binding transcriptional regulator YhcF (GntR family)